MVQVFMGRPYWSVGTMSGTSMDGLDFAMLLTDGETIYEFGPTSEGHYGSPTSEFLKKCMEKVHQIPTDDLRDPALWPDWLSETHHLIARDHAYWLEGLQLSHGLGLSKKVKDPWSTIQLYRVSWANRHSPTGRRFHAADW